jgi:hypothetical protein
MIVLVLGMAGVTICGCVGPDRAGSGTASQAAAPLASVSTSAPSPNETGALTDPVGDGGACATAAWGTGTEDGGPVLSTAPLYLVRAGRHPCYDRVVFDVNGPAALGYTARYVPVVQADGSGKPVPVAGGAALEIVVRAPMLGTDSQGHQPGRQPPAVGADLVAPSRMAGWPSVRQVTYAGSFEGQTTAAIGVRTRLPFRVLVTADGSSRHIVVDIAH